MHRLWRQLASRNGSWRFGMVIENLIFSVFQRVWIVITANLCRHACPLSQQAEILSNCNKRAPARSFVHGHVVETAITPAKSGQPLKGLRVDRRCTVTMDSG
jgi:hypothetical protein